MIEETKGTELKKTTEAGQSTCNDRLGIKFPKTPPPGDMTRKQRMERLEKQLTSKGLYVQPVCMDDTYSEYGYLIVSVDDPYDAAEIMCKTRGTCRP